MEQHKGSTSPTLHFTLLQSQTEIHTTLTQWQERRPSLWIIFPPIKAKTSKPCFRWLAAFIPSWMQSGKGKLVQEGRVWEKCCTHPLAGPNQRLAVLSAWCYCTDQKLGYGEPLWNFDAIIWSMTHRFLCHCLATKLVASAAGDLATSKPALSVNQYWWLTREEKETSYASQAASLVYHR